MSTIRLPRAERWAAMTFDEQMGNLGADVGRAVAALAAGQADRAVMWAAHARVEFDLTLADSRWAGRGGGLAQAVGDVSGAAYLVFVALERTRFDDTMAGRIPPDAARFDAVFAPFAVRANEARGVAHER